jgi:hypothetical protein
MGQATRIIIIIIIMGLESVSASDDVIGDLSSSYMTTQYR